MPTASITLSFDPAGPQFAISEAAVMPVITVTAALQNIVADPRTPVQYAWRVTLGSTARGCLHAMGKVTRHPDIAVTTTVPVLRIPFTRVRGGDLSVAVVVTVGTTVVRAARTDLTIVGTDPSITSLAAATVGAPDAFKRLMRLESRLRQFRSPDCPLFSADNLGGVGLCQLTPPDSDDQIWDWKANVAGGLALYRSKEAIARAYPARVRASDVFRAQVTAYNDARTATANAARTAAAAARPPVAVAPVAPPAPVTVRVPDYTAEQLELDTVRAFNGYAGGLHEYRLKTDADGILVVTLDPGGTTGSAEWERISAAARIASYDVLGIAANRRGDPNYVDDVMKQPSF